MDVIVWGTGARAKVFSEKLGNRYNILAYADNNPETRGRSFLGKPVVAPEQIASLQPESVVVCSASYEEIRAQILRDKVIAPDVPVYGYGENSRLTQDAPFALRTWDTLQVSITNSCNLTCAHCARIVKDKGVTQIALPDYLAILEKFNSSQFANLLVSDFGEIFLAKELRGYIEALATRGWNNIECVTNGSSTNTALIEDVLKTNAISRMYVSIEAARPDLYQRIRGQSLEVLTNFLETVNRVRAGHDLKTKFYFNCACMQENIGELADIVSLARRYGFDGVSFVAMFALGENLPPDKLCTAEHTLDALDQKVRAESFGRALACGRELGVFVSVPEEIDCLEPCPANPGESPPPGETAAPFKCTVPFSHVQVHENQVYPCCQMHKAMSLGDVSRASFEEIWNAPAYAALRGSLAPGAAVLPACRSCNILKGYRW